jgi:hypothetical protein
VSPFNGKFVADAILKDIESFFLSSAKFSIRREFNSLGRLPVSFKGRGDQARITLSKDFCEHKINNIDELFVEMIILCHEVAHYLNKHNEHKNINKIDVTAIEAWADYFGARIFLTAITYGKKCRALIQRFMITIEYDAVLCAIGRALSKMYQSIYLPNTDRRYLPAIERVGVFNAGVISFFYRLHGNLKPAWTIYVLRKLLNEANLVQIYAAHNTNWDNQEEITRISSEIHQAIQGIDIAITKGLKPCYVRFLVTNYIVSPYEKYQKGNQLNNQTKKISLMMDESTLLLPEHNY